LAVRSHLINVRIVTGCAVSNRFDLSSACPVGADVVISSLFEIFMSGYTERNRNC